MPSSENDPVPRSHRQVFALNVHVHPEQMVFCFSHSARSAFSVCGTLLQSFSPSPFKLLAKLHCSEVFLLGNNLVSLANSLEWYLKHLRVFGGIWNSSYLETNVTSHHCGHAWFPMHTPRQILKANVEGFFHTWHKSTWRYTEFSRNDFSSIFLVFTL